MTFTYSYREKTGKLASATVDAESREDALRLASASGRSVIRMEKGGVTSLSGTLRNENGRRTILRGVLAGVLVVVVALGVWFLVSEDGTRDVMATGTVKSKTIPTVSPLTNRVLSAGKSTIATNREHREICRDVTNENPWIRGFPPLTKNIATVGVSRVKSGCTIFKHGSENTIANYLLLKPGATLIGLPKFGKMFERDFLKSLETPIVVSETDSEEVKKLKRAVIDAKIMLKERLDAGEDLSKIMQETHLEFQQMGIYRMNLENELKSLARKRDTKERDLDDYLQAANELLSQKGIAPISLNRISRRAIKLGLELENQKGTKQNLVKETENKK